MPFFSGVDLRIRCVAFFCILVVAGCHPAREAVSAEEELGRGWRAFRLSEFGEAEGDFLAALKGARGEDAGAVHLRANATYGLGLVASLAHRGEAGAAGRARGGFLRR